MEHKDLKSLVELYFDGELKKEEEPVLFSLLSQNEEARLYFKQLHVLRTSILESEEQLPFSVEENIMYSIAAKERKKAMSFFRGWMPALAYAAAVLLFALSMLLFWQMNNYQQRVDVVTQQLLQQSRTMELILNNSLPPAEIQNQKEIIIKANL